MGTYLSEPIKTKLTTVGNTMEFQYCISEMQGWRKSMETACLYNLQLPSKNYLFAIFDGHGGCQVSQLVSQIFVKQLIDTKQYKHGLYKQALQTTFKRIDDCISSKQGQKRLLQLRYKSGYAACGTDEVISKQTGTTANVVLITKDKVFIANIGDSKCILIKKRDITQLSVDQTPNIQQQANRINEAGGNIIRGKINGQLGISRAFGDFIYKSKIQLPWEKQLVICKPTITVIDRSKEQHILFICCAGVWEKYGADHTKLGRVLSQVLKDSQQDKNRLKIGMENFFEHLIASDRKDKTGFENMSAIIIKFG